MNIAAADQPKKEVQESATEVIAKQLEQISEGIKILRSGRLNEKALIYLLYKSSGVTQENIKFVLNSLENLSKEYLRPF